MPLPSIKSSNSLPVNCHNSFSFNEKHGKSNYYLKEHGYSVDMDINMKMFDVNDNKIYIKYVIADTECEYELLIEMGDIL